MFLSFPLFFKPIQSPRALVIILLLNNLDKISIVAALLLTITPIKAQRGADNSMWPLIRHLDDEKCPASMLQTTINLNFLILFMKLKIMITQSVCYPKM
jgi:hypothetical protein